MGKKHIPTSRLIIVAVSIMAALILWISESHGKEKNPFDLEFLGGLISTKIAAHNQQIAATQAQQAATADIQPQYDLPDGIEIEKDNDLTAAMLSNLFGPVWRTVAGDAAADSLGGIGKFSGVVTMCLGFLNLIAMGFVSMAILYIWGIAAVSTAHYGGKIGGRVNTLWLPVRHAFAICCVTPVYNGVSLLMIIILSATSWGINSANAIWDAAGAYIVEHAQQGIIDNSPPFIEEESLALIWPAFQIAVHQTIGQAAGYELQPVPVKELPTSSITRRNYVKIQSAAGGRYAVVTEPLNGAVAICPMPIKDKSIPFGGLGCIHIPTYKFQIEDGNIILPKGKDKVIYDAHIGITRARVQATINFLEGMRLHANQFLGSSQRGGRETVPFIANPGAMPQSEDALYLARQYRLDVMTAAQEHIAVVKSENNVKKMLEGAVDNHDGKSRIGWATAGLFTYQLAQTQARLDDVVFGTTTAYRAPADPIDYESWTLSPDIRDAMREAPGYAQTVLTQNRVYNPVSEEGDGPSMINKLITGVFLGGDNMSNGILSGTLAEFSKADPIVVLSNFGKKCVEIGGLTAIASLVGAAGAWIPFIGDSLQAIATNPFLVGGMTALWSVGVVLHYVAPFTIFAMWCWGISKWLLTTFAALCAAPFWACSHVMPEGDGFAGQSARQGYVMLMSLTIRPVMMTIGAVAAVGLWQASSGMYATLLASFLNGFTASSGKSVISELILSVIVMIIYYWIYYQIFKFCINDLHDLVMKWIGQHGASIFGDDGSAGGHITATAGAVAGSGAGMAGKAFGAEGFATGAAHAAGKGAAGAGNKMYQAARNVMGKKSPAADLPGQIAPAE